MAIIFSLRSDDADFYAYRSISSKYPGLGQSAAATPFLRTASGGAIGGYYYDSQSTATLNYTLTGSTSRVRSFLMRIRYASLPTGSGSIILYDIGSANSSPYMGFDLTYSAPNRRLNAIAYDDARNLATNTQTTIAISAATWHDICWTWDGTTTASKVKIYLDGASPTLATASFALTNPLSSYLFRNLSLGVTSRQTNTRGLLINEVVIWDEEIDFTQAIALTTGTGVCNGAGRSYFVDAVQADGGNTTDPGIINVRNGTSYFILGNPLSGTAYIPSAANVRNGTAVDATVGSAYIPSAADVRNGTNVDATTGTAYIPIAGNVRSGVNVDATTGSLVVPTLANTKIDVAGDGGTGTYDGSDRWTDPNIANVKLSTAYKANSLTNNRTGTLESTDPGITNVKTGVGYIIESVSKVGNYVTAISTDPGVDNVRDGTAYTINDSAKEGTLDLPVEANVRFGISYDNGDSLGIAHIPSLNDVRDGIDVESTVGVLDLPAVSDVKLNVKFDNETKTGSYNPFVYPLSTTIFPVLECEDIVQTNDKTRISGIKTFVSKDEAAITVVRIKPSADDAYVVVTGTSYSDWFLDWQYITEGTKTVTLEVTTDGVAVANTTTITVVSPTTDALYSSDSDLVAHESDILKYVRAGRNTFLDIHRLAQTLILQWLDEQGYVDIYNDKFTKADLSNDDVTAWSKYVVLRLIFESMSNVIDDIFSKKSKKYEADENRARNRSVLRLDTDASGTIEDYELLNPSSGRLLRK